MVKPLTNAERQVLIRERRKKLGLTQRQFYLTDKEYVSVKEYVKKIRWIK